MADEIDLGRAMGLGGTGSSNGSGIISKTNSTLNSAVDATKKIFHNLSDAFNVVVKMDRVIKSWPVRPGAPAGYQFGGGGGALALGSGTPIMNHQNVRGSFSTPLPGGSWGGFSVSAVGEAQLRPGFAVNGMGVANDFGGYARRLPATLRAGSIAVPAPRGSSGGYNGYYANITSISHAEGLGPNSGPSNGGMMPWLPKFGKALGGAATAAFGAALMNTSDDFKPTSVAGARLNFASGGAYGSGFGGTSRGAQSLLGWMGPTLDKMDSVNAYLRADAAGFSGSNSMGILRAAGGLSRLNPILGNGADAAGSLSGMFSAQSINQARVFGINPLNAQGAPDPNKYFYQLYQMASRGGKATRAQVENSFMPGRQNYILAQTMGVDPNVLKTAFETYASNGGKYIDLGSSAAQALGNATGASGSDYRSGASALAFGQQSLTSNTQILTGLLKGFNDTTTALGNLDTRMSSLIDSNAALGQAVHDAAVLIGGAKGASGTMGMNALSTLGKLGLGAAGATLLRRGGARLFGRLGGRAGSLGGVGATGVAAGVLEGAAAGLGAYAGLDALQSGLNYVAPTHGTVHKVANAAATVGKFAGAGAAGGAVIGSVVPVVGTGIGAAVGAVGGTVVGGVNAFFNWRHGGGASPGGGVGGSVSGSNTGLLQYAEAWMGTPYSWGGGGTGGPSRGVQQGANTVGFDCSGFTQNVYARYGVHLPRTAAEQAKMGQAVDKSQAQPGDLICISYHGGGIDHVGIYLGNGVMVNAPHTGATVRNEPVPWGKVVTVRRLVGGGRAGVMGNGVSMDPGQKNMLDPYSYIKNSFSLDSYLSGAYSGGGGGGGGSLNALEGSPGVGGSFANGSGSMGISQVAQILREAGFRGEGLVDAVAISSKESGFNANAHNGNARTGDNSYGLFQINMLGAMGPARRKQFGLSNNNQLFNPLTNAKAAYAISGGGSNWGPWSTKGVLNNGAYLQQIRQQIGSYSQGTWNVPNEQIAKLHRGEMVLPAELAQSLRTAISDGFSSRGGGGQPIILQMMYNPYNQQEAIRIAKVVKGIIDQETLAAQSRRR